ncbi:MAG: NAD(+)/NADH kinase, partial [Acidobacteria bacterium]|nr:NAD(+)/NADH kinase [Acidobacteriota bacterium]
MPAAVRFRDAALIYNPLAGRGRRERELDRAAALLATYSIRSRRLATTGPGSGTDLARREVAAGRDLIIACGGDGTINEVVNGMVGSSVPLAILPAGTGNAAATALGIPRNLWRAAGYIPRGVVRRIALGRAGSRYFVCFAGAGFDAHGVERLNRMGRLRFKFIRATLEVFRELWLYGFPTFDVHIGNEVYSATQLILGRLKYSLLPVTPRADLFGDDFEVCLITRHSPLHFVLYPLAALTRTLEYFPEVRYLRARQVRAVPR